MLGLLRRTKRIQITEDHIERGQQCDSIRCPIAIAVEEAGYQCLEVTPRAVEWVGGASLHERDNPHLIYWLERFDDGGYVEPTYIDLPKRTKELHHGESQQESSDP